MEYGLGVNEFIKSGLTELPSETVKPPRVAQSPVQFECVVNQIISLGDGPGAGNLVVAEIKRMHINEDILAADGKIDQQKIDLVARLGGDWYCRVTADNLFKVPKPNTNIGIGVDALPQHIRLSNILSGNDLGQLGNLSAMPAEAEIETCAAYDEVKELLDATIGDERTRNIQLHLKAKALLAEGRIAEALAVLMIG